MPPAEPLTTSASAAGLPLWAWLLPLAAALLLAGVAVLWRGGHLRPSLRPQLRRWLQRGRGRPGLAGLTSREDFELALDDAVSRCDREGSTCSLLFINFDNLPAVNEGYGYEQADALIAAAADRLLQQAGPGTVLARMGGVEFALLTRLGQDSACTLAGRLCARLSRPDYPVPGRSDAAMSCSIGLAAYPLHGSRLRLLANASVAMRQVKLAGGGDYMLFDPKMAVDHREQAELLADLRKAVERGELELYYQPKVDATNLQITAAEALLRWHHPKRGMISPAVFIPLAERHGLIGAIGNWVIDDATRQAAAWRDGGLRMRVAINISAYQMRQDDLVDRIEAALKRHRLQPGRFTCEITESVAMEDTRVTQRSFERLRDAGLHVSIDDFGVGQASLSYLRRLPAAELKIDASFVQDMEHNTDARSIVDAVIKLAHALNLRVVAEGVETERQRDLLVRLQCDELQGFLFARPMSARALGAWAMLDNDRGYEKQQQAAGFRDSLFRDTQPQEV